MKTKQKSVSIDSIIVDARFRKDLGDKSSEKHQTIEALAASIKEHGLLHPLVVRQDEGCYHLLAGERRLVALKQLKWEEVPVHIFPETVDSLESRLIELVENIDRKDLEWQEIAQLQAEIDKLMKEKHGERKRGKSKKDAPDKWSSLDTAELVGVSRSVIDTSKELVKAMEVFPEVKSARTRQLAIGRLNAQKTKTGQAIQQAESPDIERLKTAIKGLYKPVLFEEATAKARIFAELIILPRGIDDELLEKFRTETIFTNGWIVTFSEADATYLHNKKLVVREALWLWQIRSGGEAQKQLLTNHYQRFFYCRKGQPVLAKPGRSAVFSFKEIPRQHRSHNDERPIDLYQEIVSTFAHQTTSVLAPDPLEGNIILGAVNCGIKCVGYGDDDSMIEAFQEKVRIFPPTRYTSFPENLKMEEE